MSYTQIIQVEAQPVRYDKGFGQQVADFYAGVTQGDEVTMQFNATYNDGFTRAARVLLQAENNSLGLDPNKSYRVTIEEVTP